MKRHPIDLFSLLSGLALVLVATAALFDVSTDVAAWAWPGLLIAVGVIVLVTVLGRTVRSDEDARDGRDELPGHHRDPERAAALAEATAEVEAADGTTD